MPVIAINLLTRWWCIVVLSVKSFGADKGKTMKAETILAELNRLRKDLDEDPTDLEWLTLHHAFCFISYKMGDFQKYMDEQARQGAFDQFEK